MTKASTWLASRTGIDAADVTDVLSVEIDDETDTIVSVTTRVEQNGTELQITVREIHP